MHIFKPVFLTLMVVGTCRSQVPTVATLFPDVTSLADLQEVFPGITVGQLLELRKPVEAPYLGLRELVRGDTIEYRVDNPTSRQSAVEDALFGTSRLNRGAIVHGIDSWEPTDPPYAAERKWTDRAIALQSRTKGGVKCFITKRAGITRTVLAHDGSAWLGVQLIEKRMMRSVGGDRIIPPIVITFVSTKLDPYVPAQLPRETITCPI